LREKGGGVIRQKLRKNGLRGSRARALRE